jgi:hypothetical protein
MPISCRYFYALGTIVLTIAMPGHVQAETIQTQTNRANWSTEYRRATDFDAQSRYLEAEVIYRQILKQPRPESMNDYMYYHIQLELGKNLQSQGKCMNNCCGRNPLIPIFTWH